VQVIPVLDLQGGVAVHAVRGERSKYRPLRSRLAPSADPVTVARAVRERLGLDALYIADLDALEGRAGGADALLGLLARDGFRLLVDAAASSVASVAALLELGAHDAIVALETLRDPAQLAAVVREIGAERIVFSLDLQGGRPRGGPQGWRSLGPLEIARRAADAGVRRVLLLDLAAVGSDSGWPLAELARAVRALSEEIDVLSGGGVRNREDLECLRELGVSAALVGTALHAGRIGRADLLRLM
jgi:phosphoribosylformimino-5-aminoimidazole carboxamide ribotide isomerase